MIYVVDITTPANTPRASPVTTLLRVTSGLVYRFALDFPAGAVGLHHVWVQDGGSQIWPTSPGTTFHPDDSVIAFDETYLKTSPPFEFVVHSYNSDDTYAHTAQLRLGMVSQARLWARFLGQDAPELRESGGETAAEALVRESEAARTTASILSRALSRVE